jgi:hypothetical protein
VNTVIVHLSPYAADIDRLNSANEPQGCSVSVRLFFNPQHWSAIPFSAVARYRHKIMDPPREAVGIGSANPGECASSTDWKIQGHSLCFFGNS